MKIGRTLPIDIGAVRRELCVRKPEIGSRWTRLRGAELIEKQESQTNKREPDYLCGRGRATAALRRYDAP